MALTTYDEFMSRPREERLSIFNRVTPANRAHLVQTHLTRWINREKIRLSAEQRGILEEALSAISPAWYSHPRGTKTRDTLMELEDRVARVLSRDDMMQALTMHGEYIPLS